MAPPRAPIAVGTSTDSGNKTTQNWSFNHTVTDLPSRVLVLGICTRDAGTAGDTVISSVTYGGVAMTIVRDDTVAGTTSIRSTICILVNPPAGVNSVAVSGAGVPDQARGLAVNVSNVDQTTPQDVSSTGTNGSTSPASLSITSATDGAVGIGILALNATSTITPASGGGQTEIDENGDGANYNMEMNYKLGATAGAIAMNLTVSGSRWGYSIIALRPRRRKPRTA